MNSHYIRVVTKPCNMKLVIGITLISVTLTSRYTVTNRGTVPTKIYRVLTVMVLPRCSPGFGPGSTTVSSRCRPVCPGFTTVHPGSIPVHPGGFPVHPGPATVMPRCLPVLIMLATGVNRDGTRVNRDATGLNRDAIGANRGKPWPNSQSRFVPVASRFTPVESRFPTVQFRFIPVPSRLPTVCAGSSRFITVESRCYHGLSRCRPGFYISSVHPGSPRCIKHFDTIVKAPRFSPVLPGLPR